MSSSKNKPTFANFFALLKKQKYVSEPTKVNSKRLSEKREGKEGTSNEKQTIYTDVGDDESVTNPFTDGSDNGDIDWDPDSQDESDGSSHSSIGCEKSCVVIEDSRSSDGSQIFPALSAAALIPKVSIAVRASKNVWDKKHCCVYCSKFVNKMSTHLQRVHKNELAVARVLAKTKGSSERRTAWAELLNQGDYQHNYSVLESGTGQLIPKYRTKKRCVEDCVMCPYCKALYGRSLLYQHSKNCSMRDDFKTKGKSQAVRQGAMLMPLPHNVSQRFFSHVVSRMLKDDITRIVLNDSLIIRFGERKLYATDVEEHTPGHISSRIRELGRLLNIIRQRTDMAVSTLTQTLHPQNFDLLIQSIRELAEFNEEQHHFNKGSLALRLGHSIKKCVSVLKAEAIKNDDTDLITQANRFDSLFSGDWFDYISANAGQSVYKERFNKPTLLPSCADIEKVHKLLDEQMKSNDYTTCTKATLCSVSLFNRKRGGEVQRLKADDFEKGMQCGTSNPETFDNLSELEKKLVNHFHRIEIRGKFCRKVPILLTSYMVDCIKKTISLPMQQNPPVQSKYLFATKTGERPYRGSDVIREYAKKAQVSNTSLFTFTHLRKQVATISQTLQITKWEQDQLATFLGHDIRVHRNIYRQPLEVLLDRAKVAKILLAVNKGVSVDFEGSVDENDELNCEPHDDNESDMEEDLHSNGKSNTMTNNSPESEVEEGMDSNDKSNTLINDSPKVTVPQRSKTRNVYKEKPKQRQQMKRQPWSDEEVAGVKRHLSHCIVSGNVPRKDQAMKAVAAEPVLRKRSWRNVKDFVYNLIKKQRK